MELTARGWNRNMGATVIGRVRLSDVEVNVTDRNMTTTFGQYSVYFWDNLTVTWGQHLKFTGQYLMSLAFSYDDIDYLHRAARGVPTREQVKNAIRIMPTGELLSIFAEIMAEQDRDEPEDA